MELKPDPRIEIENTHDKEAYEREAREKALKQEEERIMKVA
jgi:hypothetical protein